MGKSFFASNILSGLKSLNRDIKRDVRTIGAWRRHQEGSSYKSYVSIRVNDQWLLIFDNCDDLNLLLSILAQGMTSWHTKPSLSKRLRLPELEDMNTGVAILSRWPGRVLSHAETKSELDIIVWNVLDSARRLYGFLLDLATARTYLGQRDFSYKKSLPHQYYSLTSLDCNALD